MLASPGTSEPVRDRITDFVASGSTFVEEGLKTGGRGARGGLASVSSELATGSDGVGPGGRTTGEKDVSASSDGLSGSWLVVSPLAATPVPCGLPLFKL